MKKDKKRNKHRTLGNIIILFLPLSLIVTVLYVYLSSAPLSICPVKEIRFTGNKHLTDDELEAFVSTYRNRSLIITSNGEVGQSLLKSPWIKTVNVRKEFPGTLSIRVDEAVPFALLDLNGHLFLVDERGKLLEELKGDSVPFLPIITSDPFNEGEAFSEAVKIARLMATKGFSSEKNNIEIVAHKPQELTVIIDGTIVKIGSGRYEEKLERLVQLEDEINRRKIPVDYIDLRFSNRAIVKPVTEVIK
ncbi:MAG: FtsQ-type POTRA domain-containing protein [Nitrospirota bacterium]